MFSSSFSLCRTTRFTSFDFLFVVLCPIQEFFVTSSKVVRISTMKWRIHVMCLSPCTGPLYLSLLIIFRIRIPILNTFINPRVIRNMLFLFNREIFQQPKWKQRVKRKLENVLFIYLSLFFYLLKFQASLKTYLEHWNVNE